MMHSAARHRVSTRLVYLCATVILACVSAAAASAQSGEERWPDKPIHMIVPLPAGSAVDVLARAIGGRLSERLGQPIINDNRSGASGVIAAETVAKAAPDGYTLGMATSTTHVTTAILNPKLPYDPVKDFSPVALIGIVPYVLAVSPQLPVHNLQELLALARSKPKALSYSSVGQGSLAHLATELMDTMAGVQMTHIPYRASGPALLDLAEGRIDVTIGVLATALPLIQQGKVRPLAVTTEHRVPTLPNVPTMAEAGLPGFEASLWFAIMGPAGLPAPIVGRLNRETNEIVMEPDVKSALARQGTEAEMATPDKLRQLISADLEKWRAIAVKAGVTPR